MPRLRRVSGSEAIRALEKLGFEQVRQRGSHVVLKKDTPGGGRGMRGAIASRTGRWHLAWHSETSWSDARPVYGETVI